MPLKAEQIFDPNFPLVAARPIVLHGQKLDRDDPIPSGVLSERRMRQLHEWRRVKHPDPQAVMAAFLERRAKRGQPVKPPSEEEKLRQIGTDPAEPKWQAPAMMNHNGGGWYTVIDGAGSVVTETKVRKADAEALVAEINGEE